MIPEPLREATTAAGDAMIAIPALLLAILATLTWRRAAVTRRGRIAVTGIAVFCYGVSLRVLPWMAAIWTREPGERRAAWVLDWYADWTIAAGVLCVVGGAIASAGISRRGGHMIWCALGLAVGLSTAALGFIPALLS